MIDCDQVSELISGYVDGELDEDDAALVAEHLDLCPECREMLDYERDAKEIVKSRHVQNESSAEVRRVIIDGIAYSSGPPLGIRNWPTVVALLKPLMIPLMLILALLLGVVLAASVVRNRAGPARPVRAGRHHDAQPDAQPETAPAENAPESH